MFPAPFDYHRAGTVDEALELLRENQDREAKLLAGGHSLIPMMKQRLAQPDVLIDIRSIGGLAGIEEENGSLRVGALTRHVDLERSKQLRAKATCLAEAASEVGDVQVRNRGTIGGNLAHADPASDLPAPFLSLGGTVHARGPDGTRTIPAEDFFYGLFMTDLGEEELMTSLELPVHDDSTHSTYVKKPSPSSGYAMVGVAAVITLDGDRVEKARLAANGMVNYPCRLTGAEEVLEGRTLEPEVLEEASVAADRSIEEDEVLSDLQASAEYRLQLLKVYTRRALDRLHDRIQEER